MSDGGSEPFGDRRWRGSVTAGDPDLGSDRAPDHDPGRGPDRDEGREGRRTGSPNGRHRAGGRRPADQHPGGQRPVEGRSMEPSRANSPDRGDPRLAGDPWLDRDPPLDRDPSRRDTSLDSWRGQRGHPADETSLDLRVTGRPIPGRSRGGDPYRDGAGPFGPRADRFGTGGADVRREAVVDPRRGFDPQAGPGPGAGSGHRSDSGRGVDRRTEPGPGRRRAPATGPVPSAPLSAPLAPALDGPASGARRARHADPGVGPPWAGGRSGPGFGRETGTRPGSGPGQERRFGPRADLKFGPRTWPEQPAEMRAGPDTALRPSRPAAEPDSRAAALTAAPRAPWAP